MLWLKISLFLLFFPASFGLLWQSLILNSLSEQLISFAFFLFSLEQARMAFIDITSYSIGKSAYLSPHPITTLPQEIKQESETLNFTSSNNIFDGKNNKLSQFLLVVIFTIIIELFGFYLALFSLGWGAIFVLISQICFNILAPLKVLKIEDFSLTNYHFSDKVGILLADTICIVLMSLWINNFYPLTIGFIILFITLTFAGVKYGTSL
jgi:hypothetical protein